MLSQGLLEAVLICELLAEQRYGPYLVRGRHISASLMAGRAGNGHSRAWGVKESYPSLPLLSISPAQPWILPTSCPEWRVTPAEGVRRERPHQWTAQTWQWLWVWGALFQDSCPLPCLPPCLHYSCSFWTLLPFLFPMPYSSSLLILLSLTATPFSLFLSAPAVLGQKKEWGAKVRGKSFTCPRCY